MNKDDVVRFLAELLKNFWVHGSLTHELVALIAQTGVEQKVFNTLLTRLKFLKIQGIMATRHKEFEPISNGIYSMHITGNGFNLRILYSFAPDKSPVLLLAFYERAGKKKTDYTPHVPVAVQRMKEEMEAHGYDY